MKYDEINLHCRSVQEAMEKVQSQLEWMLSHEELQALVFIHGKGLHSAHGQSRIRTAVRKFFEEKSALLDEKGLRVIRGDEQFPITESFDEGVTLLVRKGREEEHLVNDSRQIERNQVVFTQEGKEKRQYNKKNKKVKRGKQVQNVSLGEYWKKENEQRKSAQHDVGIKKNIDVKGLLKESITSVNQVRKQRKENVATQNADMYEISKHEISPMCFEENRDCCDMDDSQTQNEEVYCFNDSKIQEFLDEKKYESASVHLLREIKAYNNVEAMLTLARLYEKGLVNGRVDMFSSISMYRKAAKVSNDPQLQYLYASKTIEMDWTAEMKNAIKSLEKAAEQGYELAKLKLIELGYGK